jgi:signal transducing adaptor molecule
MLHESNPEVDRCDLDLSLERHVNSMGPLIDVELERVDRKHAQLTQLSAELVGAFNLYHSLMREQPKLPSMPQYNYMPPQVSNPPPNNKKKMIIIIKKKV